MEINREDGLLLRCLLVATCFMVVGAVGGLGAVDPTVLEAADYGIKKMNELFYKREQHLYDIGLWLAPDNPARFVAAFNRQSPRARDLAKYGYASLQATSRLMKHYSKSRISIRPRIPNTSLLNTALHAQCPLRDKPVCPTGARYRTPDGRCNNPAHPWRGAAMLPLHRFLPSTYADGVERIRVNSRGDELPSARAVSTEIHEDKDYDLASISHMVMQWGQFLDHDLTSSAQSRGYNESVPQCCTDDGRSFQPPHLMNPDCLPIRVPDDDWFYSRHGVKCLEFTRSSPTSRFGCSLGPRDQVNQVTSFLDASNVFGSSQEEANQLRLYRNGLLKYSRVKYRLPLLPRAHGRADLCRDQGHGNIECFLAGDKRVNEQPGLIAMHVVWMRAHNRIADELRRINAHWDDERLYQEARRIIIAMMQHITYKEFLPIVLGPDVTKLFNLDLQKRDFFDGYDINVNPMAANAFATAAFRFGHSLVQRSLVRCDRNHKNIAGNVSLREEMTNPSTLYNIGAVDRLLLGLITQHSQKRDEFITEELTNHLFQTPRYGYGMDLAAINIQRGRDHGIPPYTAWREPCGLQPITSWTDLFKVAAPETVRRLQNIYSAVSDIDLFPGAMAERPVMGGLVGPTFACIIAQQFSNLRLGDRFWYENGGFESSFTQAQLQQLRRVTLARVLCDNLDIVNTIQPFVLLAADNHRNERVSCDSIVNFDLKPWKTHPIGPNPDSTTTQKHHHHHHPDTDGEALHPHYHQLITASNHHPHHSPSGGGSHEYQPQPEYPRPITRPVPTCHEKHDHFSTCQNSRPSEYDKPNHHKPSHHTHHNKPNYGVAVSHHEHKRPGYLDQDNDHHFGSHNHELPVLIDGDSYSTTEKFQTYYPVTYDTNHYTTHSYEKPTILLSHSNHKPHYSTSLHKPILGNKPNYNQEEEVNPGDLLPSQLGTTEEYPKHPDHYTTASYYHKPHKPAHSNQDFELPILLNTNTPSPYGYGGYHHHNHKTTTISSYDNHHHPYHHNSKPIKQHPNVHHLYYHNSNNKRPINHGQIHQPFATEVPTQLNPNKYTTKAPSLYHGHHKYTTKNPHNKHKHRPFSIYRPYYYHHHNQPDRLKSNPFIKQFNEPNYYFDKDNDKQNTKLETDKMTMGASDVNDKDDQMDTFDENMAHDHEVVMVTSSDDHVKEGGSGASPEPEPEPEPSPGEGTESATGTTGGSGGTVTDNSPTEGDYHPNKINENVYVPCDIDGESALCLAEARSTLEENASSALGPEGSVDDISTPLESKGIQDGDSLRHQVGIVFTKGNASMFSIKVINSTQILFVNKLRRKTTTTRSPVTSGDVGNSVRVSLSANSFLASMNQTLNEESSSTLSSIQSHTLTTPVHVDSDSAMTRVITTTKDFLTTQDHQVFGNATGGLEGNLPTGNDFYSSSDYLHQASPEHMDAPFSEYYDDVEDDDVATTVESVTELRESEPIATAGTSPSSSPVPEVTSPATLPVPEVTSPATLPAMEDEWDMEGEGWGADELPEMPFLRSDPQAIKELPRPMKFTDQEEYRGL